MNKKNSFIVLAVVVVALLVCGVTGVFANFQSPSTVLKKMAANMSKVNAKTENIDAELAMDISTASKKAGGAPTTVKLTGSFVGKVDSNDEKNPKMDSVLTINVTSPDFGAVSGTFDFKSIADATYIKVEDAHLPAFLPIDITPLKGVWMKLDTADLKKLPSGADSLASKITPEEKQQVLDLFKDQKIFTNLTRLPSEKIDGINTFHFQFGIDKEALKALILKITELQKAHASATDKTPIPTADEMNKTFDGVTFNKGEFWIGKNDYMPYKASIDFSIADPKSPGDSGHFVVSLSMKDFGKPVTIEAPTDAKDFKTVFGNFMAGLGMGAPTR